MPLVPSRYRPKRAFRQTDVNTIYAGTLRRKILIEWERERLELEDGDFVDLDWLIEPGSTRLAVLAHGLEGHARRPYMAGMARAYQRAGFNVCAMNFRGCSGEPNRHLRSYHIGETGDLRQTIKHAIARVDAEIVMLTGYSLGGNVIVKYLGEDPDSVPNQIIGAAVFSVPLFVAECSEVINNARNWAYRWSFIAGLNKKAKQKVKENPEIGEFKRARRFDEFDEWYTAPWHGFSSAKEYWEECSSGNVLEKLKVPVLVVNAADDSFLTEACYPKDLAEKLDNFYLEIPEHGGHCGFVASYRNGDYYSDKRAIEFARSIIRGLGKAGVGNARHQDIPTKEARSLK